MTRMNSKPATEKRLLKILEQHQGWQGVESETLAILLKRPHPEVQHQLRELHRDRKVYARKSYATIGRTTKQVRHYFRAANNEEEKS